MPIGYSKEPPLRAFVVAKIKKENAEKSIKLYKQKFNQYFYQYEYLKLIRPSKDKEFVELLFCLPEVLQL
jgi:tRNA-specific adenosine deaminase 3